MCKKLVYKSILLMLFIGVITPNMLGQSINTTITDWSSDGLKLLVTSDLNGSSEIYEINVDGSNGKQFTGSKDGNINWWGVYSPNKSKIAFYSGRDGNAEIYVMDANGKNQKRLTFSKKYDYYPTWSPDGSKIAFYSGRDGNAEIYIMNADGSNQYNITNNSAHDQDPRWSPDGKSIIFQSNRTGKWQIYSYSLKRKKVKNLSKNKFNDELPSWSKDGSKIIFHSNRKGKGQIFTMNNDGSEKRALTNGDHDNFIAVMSPDNKSIIYTSNRNGNLEIYKKEIGSEREQKISIDIKSAKKISENDLWIQDFEYLKSQMTNGYANLKYSVEKEKINLVELDKVTISELKKAKSTEEAQKAIRRFLKTFNDGHLFASRLKINKTKVINNPDDNSNKVLNTDSGEIALKKMQYENKGYKNRIAYDSIAGFIPLEDNSNPFPASIIKSENDVIGIVRVGFLGYWRYWETSLNLWESYRKTFEGECDSSCQWAFMKEVEKELTNKLIDRINELKSKNISKLIVDVSSNSGGTEWCHAVAELFTKKHLKGAETLFIKHDHWVNTLEYHLEQVEKDLKNQDLKQELLVKLKKFKAIILDLISKCKNTCNPLDIWNNQNMECLDLISFPYSSKLPFNLIDDKQFEKLHSRKILSTYRFLSYPKGIYDGPLYIVQDRYSGSATEEFSSLLQMNDAAVIVGEKSYGAGCGFTGGGVKAKLKNLELVIRMPDCARLRKDGKNEIYGIEPDIKVDWGKDESKNSKGLKIIKSIKSHSKT